MVAGPEKLRADADLREEANYCNELRHWIMMILLETKNCFWLLTLEEVERSVDVFEEKLPIHRISPGAPPLPFPAQLLFFWSWRFWPSLLPWQRDEGGCGVDKQAVALHPGSSIPTQETETLKRTRSRGDKSLVCVFHDQYDQYDQHDQYDQYDQHDQYDQYRTRTSNCPPDVLNFLQSHNSASAPVNKNSSILHFLRLAGRDL
ncbi:unnamed protein product [Pleuronectes platessa]|uniref:Uncharacterized protein n=1 Tax=Pleuronectes platessa TaxID=8262 RepID=A0A9N7YI74_PLEPL|nr:unnamed protein product [Pleuronectes platessa]